MEFREENTNKYPPGYELETKLIPAKEDYPNLYEILAVGYTADAELGMSNVSAILMQSNFNEMAPEEYKRWVLKRLLRDHVPDEPLTGDLDHDLKVVVENTDEILWKKDEDSLAEIRQALKITDEWERTKEVNRIMGRDSIGKYRYEIINDFLAEFFPDEAGNPDLVLHSNFFDERMQSIIEGSVNTLNLIIQELPDTIVFLDKSARPFYWVILSMWKQLRPGEPFPSVRFINIGTEKSRVSPFGTPEELQKIQQAELGKKVLILDEFSASGASLAMTQRLLEQGHPQTKFVPSAICVNEPFPQALAHLRTGLFDEDEVPEGETVFENELGIQARHQLEDNLKSITFGRRITEAERSKRLSKEEMAELRQKRDEFQKRYLAVRAEFVQFGRKLALRLKPSEINMGHPIPPSDTELAKESYPDVWGHLPATEEDE